MTEPDPYATPVTLVSRGRVLAALLARSAPPTSAAALSAHAWPAFPDPAALTSPLADIVMSQPNLPADTIAAVLADDDASHDRRSSLRHLLGNAFLDDATQDAVEARAAAESRSVETLAFCLDPRTRLDRLRGSTHPVAVTLLGARLSTRAEPDVTTDVSHRLLNDPAYSGLLGSLVRAGGSGTFPMSDEALLELVEPGQRLRVARLVCSALRRVDDRDHEALLSWLDKYDLTEQVADLLGEMTASGIGLVHLLRSHTRAARLILGADPRRGEHPDSSCTPGVPAGSWTGLGPQEQADASAQPGFVAALTREQVVQLGSGQHNGPDLTRLRQVEVLLDAPQFGPLPAPVVANLLRRTSGAVVASWVGGRLFQRVSLEALDALTDLPAFCDLGGMGGTESDRFTPYACASPEERARRDETREWALSVAASVAPLDVDDPEDVKLLDAAGCRGIEQMLTHMEDLVIPHDIATHVPPPVRALAARVLERFGDDPRAWVGAATVAASATLDQTPLTFEDVTDVVAALLAPSGLPPRPAASATVDEPSRP